MPSLKRQQQLHNRASSALNWAETSPANGSPKYSGDEEGCSFDDSSNITAATTPTTRCTTPAIKCSDASSTSNTSGSHDSIHHRGIASANNHSQPQQLPRVLSTSRFGLSKFSRSGSSSSSRARSAALGVLACAAAALLLTGPLLRDVLGDRPPLPPPEEGARSRENSWSVLRGDANQQQEEHQSGGGVGGGGGGSRSASGKDSRSGSGSGSGSGGGGKRGDSTQQVGATASLRKVGRGDGVDVGADVEGGRAEASEGGSSGGSGDGSERSGNGGALRGSEQQQGGEMVAEEAAEAVETQAAAEAEALSQKLCAEHLNRYAIIPGQSWGTAPKSVQDAWATMDCDRVIDGDGVNPDDPPSRSRTRAIILVWSNIKDWIVYLEPEFVRAAKETCATECVFTGDRRLLPKADGVFFHASTHQRPDGGDGLPAVKPPGATYVFFNLEPTNYRPVQALLRDEELMSKFDLTMTYERSSDLPLGFIEDTPISAYFEAPKASFKEKNGYGEPDAVAAFVTNCDAAGAPERLKYIEELMKHVSVHSFGKCLHNREEPEAIPGGAAINRYGNKISVLGHYKFLLAFENSNQHRDYVTEKVYHGLRAGTLPVYWGAENVDDYVPKGSVIKASDFFSPAELGDYLNKLAADEAAYEEYFKWRSDPEERKRMEKDVSPLSAYGVTAMCRLCDRVLLDKVNDAATQ